MINDSVCTETGIRRFDNMFGSEAGVYFRLPEKLAESARSHEYLRLLDEDLHRLSEMSRSAHNRVTSSRRTEVTEDTQNVYLRGELVLLQRDPDKPLPTKLTMPFSGPYEVLDQVGNDVKCRHLATHVISEFPVTRLKIFHGTREVAKATAAAEAEQSQVRAITAWRGDPLLRTTMEFRTEFEDGDIIWLPYSVDLDQTQAFGDYVSKHPVLHHLQFAAQAAKEFLGKVRSQPITGYSVGDKIYVDIRCYSTDWYDNTLTFLTDRYDKVYVVIYEVIAVYNRYIKAYCPTYDERWEAATGDCKLGSYWCYAFGYRRVLTDEMVLITPELCRDHPELISPDVIKRQRVLEHHFPELRPRLPSPPKPKPPPPVLKGIPPTTRQLRSADAPSNLFMMRSLPDEKPPPDEQLTRTPTKLPPAESPPDPKHLVINVQALLESQIEDRRLEALYYETHGFASPSGRHVSPPKRRRCAPVPPPRPATPDPTLPILASPRSSSPKRPRRSSVTSPEPQMPEGERKKTPVSEPQL